MIRDCGLTYRFLASYFLFCFLAGLAETAGPDFPPIRAEGLEDLDADFCLLAICITPKCLTPCEARAYYSSCSKTQWVLNRFRKYSSQVKIALQSRAIRHQNSFYVTPGGTLPNQIKLVALDIDATLLEHGVPVDSLPDQSVVDVVRDLQEQGVVVILATGRMYPGTAPIAQHLGIEEPMICQQGASTHQANGDLIVGHTIDQDIAIELYGYAMEHGYSIAWFDHERYLVTELSPAVQYFAGVSNVTPEITPKPHESGVRATGIDIVSNAEDSSHVHRLFEAQYGNRISLLDFSTVTAFHAPQASKGNAVALFAKQRGIQQSEVFAIGDSVNDVSMLAWAGESAAPAHCDDYAREAAKEVLETPGVAGVVERLRSIIDS